MVSSSHGDEGSAPVGFGAAARDLAPFPLMMSCFATSYAIWWPFAWGWAGAAALLVVVIAAVLLGVRGVAQIRHSTRFPDDPTPEIERERTAMAVLNGITHPVWMLPSVLLIVFGQGRWVLPLMVFVIGAHFVPMARILDRRIDYLLGPVTMIAALAAGVLALDRQHSWLVVFAVAGIGGAVATVSYAMYLARAYRRICVRAHVAFSPRG